MFQTLLSATQETALMLLASGLLTILFGLPLAILMTLTRSPYLYPKPTVYRILNTITELSGSVPFLIIMVALIPMTRHVLGTDEGSAVAILPLTLAALPMFIKLCEDTFLTIPQSLIETFLSLGATRFQIIYKVILPEAYPSIIKNIKATLLHLIGYSAVAGALGAGGLGGLAIEKGFYSFEPAYMFAILFIFILLVQVIEYFGDQVFPSAKS